MTVSFNFRCNAWLAFVFALSLAVIAVASRASSAHAVPTNSLPAHTRMQQMPTQVTLAAPSSQANLPWASGFYLPGTNGIVHAAVLDGSGNLYVGGEFSVAGDVDANNIARWDGMKWHALNTGTNDAVYALAVGSDGTLYAGGTFTSAGTCTANCKRIASWNGTTWNALSTGIDSPGSAVHALVVNSDGQLYAGGTFTGAGSCMTCASIARWNGTTWSPLQSGTSGTVYALVADGTGNVYVGGDFWGPISCPDCLAVGRWDGTNWHALENGILGIVYALAVDANHHVYVGGDFTSAGLTCNTCSQIGKWNGSTWSSVGFDDSRSVRVTKLLFNAGGTLHAYAEETLSPGSPGYLATWNGAAWSDLVTDLYHVNTIVINSSGRMYIGGGFVTLDHCPNFCESVAQLNGGTWSPLGQHGRGPDGFPEALAFDENGDLYVGGVFTRAGTCTTGCNNIARWDGHNWHALGNGVNHEVTAMAFDSSGTLYAGGFGGVSRWDGAAWSMLGSEVSGFIHTMVVDGNDTLYIGGYFAIVDCADCLNVAGWGGTAWLPLDLGVNAPVHALAVDSENTLYVGGEFEDIFGNMSVCNGDCLFIATWKGYWAPLDDMAPFGDSTNGPVRALAFDSEGALYAGGDFTFAGECASGCLRIAKYTNSDWSGLEGGINGRVQSLAVDTDGTLYAAGNFTMAGTCTGGCNRIARWNGVTWHPLNNGIDGLVTGVAISHEGRVHAVGSFSHAGDKISRNFAVQSSNNVYLPVVVK